MPKLASAREEMPTPERITCPHCGEYERYQLMSVRDFKCVYWCKVCDKLHEWVRPRVDGEWRITDARA